MCAWQGALMIMQQGFSCFSFLHDDQWRIHVPSATAVQALLITEARRLCASMCAGHPAVFAGSLRSCQLSGRSDIPAHVYRLFVTTLDPRLSIRRLPSTLVLCARRSTWPRARRPTRCGSCGPAATPSSAPATRPPWGRRSWTRSRRRGCTTPPAAAAPTRSRRGERRFFAYFRWLQCILHSQRRPLQGPEGVSGADFACFIFRWLRCMAAVRAAVLRPPQRLLLFVIAADCRVRQCCQPSVAAADRRSAHGPQEEEHPQHHLLL